MSDFSFEVAEYANGLVPSKKKVGGAILAVSRKRLLVATVRSLLTTKANWTVRKYMAATISPAMEFFIDQSAMPSYRVCLPKAGHLRDFSLTSRIGEFAQGIAYAYWAFHVRSFVTDFVDWTNARHPHFHSKKWPDFAVQPFGTTDIYALEAKGTLAGKYAPQMRKALLQSKGLCHHPGITGAFATVVTFDAHGSGAASIHNQDPEGAGRADERDRHEIFKRSFASWYEMAGNEAKAAECRNETPSILEMNGLLIGYVRDSVLKALNYGQDSEFVLAPAVEEAVFSFEAYQRGDWRKALGNWSDDRLADERTDFPDGTAIIPSPRGVGYRNRPTLRHDL